MEQFRRLRRRYRLKQRADIRIGMRRTQMLALVNRIKSLHPRLDFLRRSSEGLSAARNAAARTCMNLQQLHIPHHSRTDQVKNPAGRAEPAHHNHTDLRITNTDRRLFERVETADRFNFHGFQFASRKQTVGCAENRFRRPARNICQPCCAQQTECPQVQE